MRNEPEWMIAAVVLIFLLLGIVVGASVGRDVGAERACERMCHPVVVAEVADDYECICAESP